MIRFVAIAVLALGVAACTDTRVADASAAMGQPTSVVPGAYVPQGSILTTPPVSFY